MRRKDYYEVLQVDPRAEPEVIEAAYRRLSRKYHPDVSDAPDAARRMRDLNEAYEVLSDPRRRAAYKATRPSGSPHMAKKLARAEKGKGQGQKGAAKGRKNVVVAGIIAVAVAAVLGVGYLAMSASGPQRGPDGLLARGVEAPGFSLNRLGGNGSLGLTGSKGKVVVLNFWHSQ